MSIFSSIKGPKLKRTKFNLSHDVKLSCNMGELIPILCEPVIPGDRWSCNSEVLIRFAPLKAPVMHRINVYVHYFFVPTRLLWDGFRTFITGGVDGNQVPSYPRLSWFTSAAQTRDLWVPGSLADYLGFPVASDGDSTVKTVSGIDALPFRAYQLIYNEYYRDQTLQNEVDIMKGQEGDGVVNGASNGEKVKELLTLRTRCWKKDYFTSALPWPQRGDEVELPLTGNGVLSSNTVQTTPVHVTSYGASDTEDKWAFIATKIDNPHEAKHEGVLVSANSPELTKIPQSQVVLNFDLMDPQGNSLTVDMSKVSSATINELRRAFAAQRFLEVGARGGSRYIEQILSYFGVVSSDARLQRPEFLAGIKTPVIVSDVLQTSQTTETSPQAQPAGNAVSLGRSNRVNRRFEEHGFIIGIMSVMPEPAYQQGLPRKYTKFDRYDYYWPQFAHLGEQTINETEIYANSVLDGDGNLDFDPEGGGLGDTFGYAPRYAEYKFINSSVHGDFRSTLNFWHLGRIFSTAPKLNGAFVQFDKGTEGRIFAVEDDQDDKLWINVRNNINAVRSMPRYGTPGLHIL